MKYNKNFPLELVFWFAGLITLFFTDPHQHHFSLCPLANLGIDGCPGCGLGRAIASIFNGEIKESFNYHWFGLPALLLICYRIWQLGTNILCKQTFTFKYKEN